MLAKVFDKGQVVIPAEIRRSFRIQPGDFLEVSVDGDRRCIELKKPDTSKSVSLAGSLSRYGKGRCWPSRQEMHECLKRGLACEAEPD